jgi:hypothetical protein
MMQLPQRERQTAYERCHPERRALKLVGAIKKRL